MHNKGIVNSRTFWNLLSPLFGRSFATTQSAQAILSADHIPTSPILLERLECSADPNETHLEALKKAKWRSKINEKIIHKALKKPFAKVPYQIMTNNENHHKIKLCL